MNFLKNTWNKFFKSPSSDPTSQNPPPDQHPIPIQILTELFELSSKYIRESQLPIQNETKLKLYGYYKQSTEGDCNTAKPQMFDLVGKSKWNAWNELKGKSKQEAMKAYVVIANQADPVIEKKIKIYFQGQMEESFPEQKVNKGGFGLKKVEVVDYSDEYSHPYFKPIEKGEQITEIEHKLLLQKNNSPAVYPLHFAIDKQRLELVERFTNMLSREEIEEMKDEEGMGILQYAELIENEEILELISGKLK